MKSRIKFNFPIVLLLAVFFASSAMGQSTGRDQSSKKLDRHQINQMIASAKTPQDHARIAVFFRQQAEYYDNQSRAYRAKIAAYQRTPYSNVCVMCVSTSDSLDAAIRSLRLAKQLSEERADEMLRLAVQNEQISYNALKLESSSGL